uniref:Autophagy-related protein 13 N-terminal domain-containing protein n=1 Tax=Brassica campestris TaxID=3711 RepID=M4E0Q6_BRACM
MALPDAVEDKFFSASGHRKVKKFYNAMEDEVRTVFSKMNRSSNSEGAKAEQIIFEFFAKTLHIILESRTPFMSSRNFSSSSEQIMNSPSSSSSSSSSVRPRDKWFNLALRECPAALESFDIGRRSTLEPLVVDVVLVARPFDQMNSPGGRELIRNFSGKEYHSDQDDCEGKNEQIIERWVVQYDNRKVRERRKAMECLQDFSPPCSPSAPTQAFPRSITRTESAPVRIPPPSFESKQNVVVPPSSHLKLSRHASLKPVRNTGPVESGVRLSTNSSPRISFSRSSSRSYQDDFDDTDFPCPFDVEYDENTDPSSSRPGSLDQRGDIHEPPPFESSGSYPKKSQDAGVGALVNMLKKAPPLRQDVSETSTPELCWNNNKNKPGGDQEIATASMTASGIALAAKTTADALEELRSYKEMKNVLLSQSTKDSSSPFAV